MSEHLSVIGNAGADGGEEVTDDRRIRASAQSALLSVAVEQRPTACKPDVGLRIDDPEEGESPQDVVRLERRHVFERRAGDRIQDVDRDRPHAQFPQGESHLDPLFGRLAHADDPTGAKPEPHLARPPERLPFLVYRMGRTEAREIGRCRLDVAVVGADSGLFEAMELLAVEQPHRSTQPPLPEPRTGFADGPVDLRTPVHLLVGEPASAGDERKSADPFVVIVSGMAQRLVDRSQRIGIDLRRVPRRLSAPLAILRTPAATRVHDRASIDPRTAKVQPDRIGHPRQLIGLRLVQQVERFARLDPIVVQQNGPL